MSQHSHQSSYREKLIEHLFVGELLKHAWLHRGCSLEISRPEVDNSGYDIIAEENGIIRHIQLKASHLKGRTVRQKVHILLAEKPAGCIVWIRFNEDTLELGPYLYFGGPPGKSLPDISELAVARHTKGNKDGVKAKRPNIRVVPKGQFTEYSDISALYDTLFGPAATP